MLITTDSTSKKHLADSYLKLYIFLFTILSLATLKGNLRTRSLYVRYFKPHC